MLVPLGNAVAQDQNSSPANAPTTPTTPSDTQTPPDAQTPALPADAVPGDNSPNTSRAVVPDVTQSPANPPPTNIPQYQSQLGNPLSPYNSTTANPQPTQLTQPTLYVTGVRDISQVSTNNALSQAFNQESAQGADVLGDESVMNYEHPPIERIKLGPFDLKAAAVMNVTGDDNFRGSGTNNNTKESDITFALTPALNLIYGNHDGQKGYASLIYAPTLTRLYHQSSNDTDDQNVAFNAIYPFQRLTLNVSQTYTETSGVNTDSNQRTTQNSSFTSAGATYEVDDKISVSSQIQETISTFQGQNAQGQTTTGSNNSGGAGGSTTSVNNSLTYRLSEKLTLGPNLNVGWDQPDDQRKSTYEQGLIALNYTPTEKIGMYASGGAEFRQYDQGGGNKVNPVFGVGVGYTPFDSTALTLSATQSVHSSTAPVGDPTNGQTVVSTSVGAAVTQRIVQRIYVSFSFNYNHDESSDQGQGNTGTGGTNGGDSEDTITYRPYVTFAPTEWSSISVYYQYLSNQSDFQGESYNDNQVGLSVSAQF